MAVFRKTKAKRGVRWQAVVRKRGHHLVRTFARSDDARAWAAAVESAVTNASAARPFRREDWLHEAMATREAEAAAMVLGDAFPEPHQHWTLGRACRHYRETVTPQKKGERQETLRLLAWERHALAAKRLADVAAAGIQAHVDARVAAGRSASTVRLEVLLLSALYKHAADSWKLAVGNPAAAVKLPAAAAGRQRRLEDGHGDEKGEEERMRAALLGLSCGQEMVDLMEVALETGMRLGEILDVRKGQVRRIQGVRVLERPDSKNGHARRVTLSRRAAAVLDRRAEGMDGPDRRLFRLSYYQVSGRWGRARKAAGVTGFRFHDLRHESLSRMAGVGLTIGELQAQSGHRTAQILLRYVNAKPADIARKLG